MQSICSFPECGYKVVGHGLCQAHYWQLRRTNELVPVRRAPRFKTIEAAMEHYTDRSGDCCSRCIASANTASLAACINSFWVC